MKIPTEITNWLNERVQREWIGLLEPREFSHRYDKMVGCGRMMSAGITLKVEPNAGLKLHFHESNLIAEYADAVQDAIIGVLLFQKSPILNINIEILHLDIHEIDSSYIAFYRVAKEAMEIALGLSGSSELNINL